MNEWLENPITRAILGPLAVISSRKASGHFPGVFREYSEAGMRLVVDPKMLSEHHTRWKTGVREGEDVHFEETRKS